MKKKSRFLQTPIEPFAVEAGLTADEILSRMERISFQGRSLATAHRIWRRMLEDDVTIFMGMAGALSAGGLRMIVAHLITHRYIDCLVSTGANLYHDLHETRGQHHYVGSIASTTPSPVRKSSSATTTGLPSSPPRSSRVRTPAANFCIASVDICGRRPAATAS